MSSSHRGGCKLIIKTINNKITSYFPPSPVVEDVDPEEVHCTQTEKDSDVESHASLLTPNSTPTKGDTCVLVPNSPLDTQNIIQAVNSTQKSSDQQWQESLGKENCVRRNVQKQPQKGKDDTIRQSCESPKPTQPKLTKSDTSQPTKSRKGRKGLSRPRKTPNPATQLSKSSSGQTKNASTTSSTKRVPDPTPNVLTNYFSIRRSSRRTHSDLKKERQAELEQAILEDRTVGLKVEEIAEKGRGVISTQPFARGDFVVEYVGDLISLGDAKDREKDYSTKPEFGCYMYYFNHNNKRYCIDATAESGKLGRLLNHSCKIPNCVTKVVPIKDHPHLILIAARDIKTGEELLYDYGDRSKESLAAHPWLAL